MILITKGLAPKNKSNGEPGRSIILNMSIVLIKLVKNAANVSQGLVLSGSSLIDFKKFFHAQSMSGVTAMTVKLKPMIPSPSSKAVSELILWMLKAAICVG